MFQTLFTDITNLFTKWADVPPQYRTNKQPKQNQNQNKGDVVEQESYRDYITPNQILCWHNSQNLVEINFNFSYVQPSPRLVCGNDSH